MSDCVNLLQRFGKRYKIAFDPVYDPKHRPREKLDPWMAVVLCERGEIGQGVLWLAHALETLPPGEETLDKLIRRNLSAWGPRLNTLSMQFQAAGQVVGFSADGATAMAAPGFQESQ